MRRTIIAVLLTSTLFASATHAAARKPGQTMGYYLPKTDVVVTVMQQIEQCPENGKPLEIASKLVIKPRVIAGQYVELDIRSGLFAERTTEIKLRENGTLQAFNAKSEGQGGKILGALTKVALTAISFGASGTPGWAALGGQNPPAVPSCNQNILALLKELSEREKRTDDLEAEIARDGETSARIAMLERYDAQVAEIREALTLSTKIKILDFSTGEEHLKPIDYSEWFDGGLTPNLALPGRYGFKISRDSSHVPAEIRNGDGTRIFDTSGKVKPLAALVYLRSVKVPVEIVPCANSWSARTDANGKTVTSCSNDESFSAAELTDSIRAPVPQLSGLFSLSVGRGGLFGSKEAKAEFDEFGTPTLLSYGTTSGTDDAVSVINTSMEGVTVVRDARLSELERRIEVAKARKELAELQADEE